MSNDKLEKFTNYFGLGQDWDEHWYEEETEIFITKRPPSTKELDAAWTENEKQQPANYVKNTGAGGESNKPKPPSDVNTKDYANLYLTTFMQDKNPFTLAKKIAMIPEDIREATSKYLKSAYAERGLLGDYYVSVQPFEDCRDAKEFFSKHCKTAQFIKKESKCTDCSYRSGKTCSMMGKPLFETNPPYTHELANEWIKKDYELGNISKAAALKVANNENPKKKLQSFILAKYAEKYATPKETPLRVIDTPTGDSGSGALADKLREANKKDIVPQILLNLIQKGVSYDTIVTKVASHTGSAYVKSVMPAVLKKISGSGGYVVPINAYKFAECDSDILLGNVSLLRKDAACKGCVFNDNDRKCAKLKAAFVKEAEDNRLLGIGKQILAAKNKSAADLNKALKQCVDSGLSYSDIKSVYAKNIKSADFNTQITQAVKTAEKLNPFRFSNCEGSIYKHVASVYRTRDCNACHYNEGSHCAKVKKAFSNPVKDHYNHVAVQNTADASYKQSVEDKKVAAVEAWALKQLEGRKIALESFEKAVAKHSPHRTKEIIAQAVSKTAAINTVAWNDCKKGDVYLKQANAVVMTKKCVGCSDNRAVKCGRFNKDFINPQLKKALSSEMPIETDESFFTRPDGSSRYPTVEMDLD